MEAVIAAVPAIDPTLEGRAPVGARHDGARPRRRCTRRCSRRPSGGTRRCAGSSRTCRRRRSPAATRRSAPSAGFSFLNRYGPALVDAPRRGAARRRRAALGRDDLKPELEASSPRLPGQSQLSSEHRLTSVPSPPSRRPALRRAPRASRCSSGAGCWYAAGRARRARYRARRRPRLLLRPVLPADRRAPARRTRARAAARLRAAAGALARARPSAQRSSSIG